MTKLCLECLFAGVGAPAPAPTFFDTEPVTTPGLAKMQREDQISVRAERIRREILRRWPARTRVDEIIPWRPGGRGVGFQIDPENPRRPYRITRASGKVAGVVLEWKDPTLFLRAALRDKSGRFEEFVITDTDVLQEFLEVVVALHHGTGDPVV